MPPTTPPTIAPVCDFGPGAGAAEVVPAGAATGLLTTEGTLGDDNDEGVGEDKGIVVVVFAAAVIV